MQSIFYAATNTRGVLEFYTLRSHTHKDACALPCMYEYWEIKVVVRRCLLPSLIKNSVNEAALSPQIEQMNMR